MTSHFRAVWNELNPSGTASFPGGLDAIQAVTLASLVERETPRPEERPLVAGVFYNRLRLGTPLQCDPTVQYALQLAGRPEQNVRPEHLRIDSPYNTYAHKGLPPGPIANPGEASLRAALNPAQPITCILWPTIKAAIFSARRSPSTIATWPATASY